MLNVARKFVLAGALALSASALAEDTPFVKLLGFSQDGRYMAFQESYIMDGSGGYQSTVRVLDTAKDQYVGKKAGELMDGDQPSKPFGEFVGEVAADASTLLNKFGIQKKLGETVHVSSAPRISSFNYKGAYVSLLLNEKAVKLGNDQASKDRVENCSFFDGAVPEAGSLLGYTLRAWNAESYKESVLDDDKGVPASRGCPTGYTLSSAFAHGNTVVLLVATRTYGFEGPDVSYVTVPFDIKKLK